MPWALGLQAVTPAAQQLQRGVQGLPPPASLLPTTRLQGEPFGVGVAPQPLLAVMAMLLKVFVIHRASSFPGSSLAEVGVKLQVQLRSRVSHPFRVGFTRDN